MTKQATASNNPKSKIYKVLASKDGVIKDYPVQAWEKTIDYALTLVAQRLNISEKDVWLAHGYPRHILEIFWKDPSKLFIRDRETVTETDTLNYKLGEQAQSDLNALLKPEPLKTISEGNLNVVKDIDGKRTVTNELRFRPFYMSVGVYPDGQPIRVMPADKPRVRANRAFYTDTNDMIYDDPDTLLLTSTDFIVPYQVKGKTDEESINSVFRFPCLQAAYKYVRQQLITSGIADSAYRLNPNLTYLEACDSWLCGTGIKMGNKEASAESVTTYIKDMAKVKVNGKLKYPKKK